MCLKIICNDILGSSSSIVTSKIFILGNETSLNVDYTKKEQTLKVNVQLYYNMCFLERWSKVSNVLNDKEEVLF